MRFQFQCLEPVHLEDHTKNLLDNSGSTRVMGSTGVGGGVQRKLDVDSMDRPKLLSLLTAKNRGVGKEEDEQEEKEDLVVVGSLIGRPANLGGLCRTCEVFGVRTLCLNNARLVEHVEFQALSLSAEKLVRIEEVCLILHQINFYYFFKFFMVI